MHRLFSLFLILLLTDFKKCMASDLFYQMCYFLYVTVDLKTSHKFQFFKIASSES